MQKMKRLRLKTNKAVWLLSIIYVVGIIGLNSPLKDTFRVLTPLNLVITALILFYYHKDWGRSFIYFCLLVYTGGYFIELIGTTTGNVFGQYFYGKTLGLRIMGVPLIIGLNWLILIYSVGVYLAPAKAPMLLKIIGGSLLMVLIDVFIEPVAMASDFWQWESGMPPLLNYIGWFFTSSVFFTVFYMMDFKKENKIAPFVYYIQLMFFLIMSLSSTSI